MTRDRRPLIWSATFAALVAVGACAAPDSDTGAAPSADTAAPGTDTTSTDTTSTDSRAAALDVRASGCGPRESFGTGTLIEADMAVTAAHVVAGASEVYVIDVDGNESSATVVFFDPDLDVAVLRTAIPVGSPVRLRNDVAVDDRGVITLIRRVDGAMDIEQEEVVVLRTVTVETTDIYLDGDVSRPGFEVSGSIEPGDSGSLVMFPEGAAGLIWARSTERNERAWAVRLPDDVTDAAQRQQLAEKVDVGMCVS